ncbi:hypothetical protein GGTG_05484 [Gaeumannomyces tritici R3-111a-1]|uniref:CoA-binding domain-containing protein n=1 Tax=Gaeumannomyces tritici (strain R3-111a-1) TaxID=644352 RepID=J3NW21_GAET3|nr:hypothetical protein GGTG_05484 [Gaeumannomyces tritici R3-111a-1]EJT75551.1 hypothetical protein GGTG_05484 [Gaeumannomyces tritici R3-111a-1]
MRLHIVYQMNSKAAVRKFFSSSRFAVVGASSDPDKYGNKVLCWYLQQSLPVTPINTKSKTIEALEKFHDAVPSLSSLPASEFTDTSVSIITHPDVTIEILKEACKLRIPAVWLQPGSFDERSLRYIREEANFGAVLAGKGGTGHGGWCILMDSEDGLKAAGKL